MGPKELFRTGASILMAGALVGCTEAKPQYPPVRTENNIEPIQELVCSLSRDVTHVDVDTLVGNPERYARIRVITTGRLTLLDKYLIERAHPTGLFSGGGGGGVVTSTYYLVRSRYAFEGSNDNPALQVVTDQSLQDKNKEEAFEQHEYEGKEVSVSGCIVSDQGRHFLLGRVTKASAPDY